MELRTQIENSKGEEIVFRDQEAHMIKATENAIKNSLGVEVDITTLTAINQQTVEQKFFEIAPSDYMPVRAGFGAFDREILTYKSFQISGDFENGLINTGSNSAGLEETDAGVEPVYVPIKNWGKKNSYNVFELAQSQKARVIDLVTEKEKARKKNWDLGIQRVAFVGLQSSSGVYGLLTQPDVTVNTTLITKFISSMTGTELTAFVRQVLEVYRQNANRTTYPTHFVIPEGDFNGLASPSDPNFPIKSKLEILLETFRLVTRNPNFQILPLAYADATVNGDYVGLAGTNRYALYNADSDSMRMDIPVSYTGTAFNTLNGFNWENVAYGQFTGFKTYRSQEMIYFDF